MGHTNSTTNYNLPQFVTTDKPAWLTDVNPAYSAIDAGIHAAKAAADDAQSDATQALSDASSAGTTASGADAKAAGSIASLADTFDTTATYNVGDLFMYNSLLYICAVAVTVPGAWTGSTNWNRTTIESVITNLNIEDLSNVSINTGDNNKLLSVNVTGSDISVGAVSSVSATPTTSDKIVFSDVSDNDNFKTATIEDIDAVIPKLHITSFIFNKSASANSEATFSVSRTELNLPSNALVKDAYIVQNSSSSTNNIWAYALTTNETASNAVDGVIFNGTATTRTYSVRCVVFYML